jgi:hypothetical protein
MFITTGSRWYWSTKKSSSPFASIAKGDKHSGEKSLRSD